MTDGAWQPSLDREPQGQDAYRGTVDAHQERRVDDQLRAQRVPIAEIQKKGFDLNIGHYISTAEPDIVLASAVHNVVRAAERHNDDFVG